MTREEFEKLMKTEREKGAKVAGAAMSIKQLNKAALCVHKAGKIIDIARKKAAHDGDLDLVADCLFVDEGLDIIMDKLICPIMDQIKAAEEAQTAEEDEEDD